MGCLKLAYRIEEPTLKVVYNNLKTSSKSCAGVYRYGFNGMEKDDEVANKEGANYTAEFWQYNSLIGRRWESDPVVNESESPYATFRNNPISLNDPNGDCPDCPNPTVNIGIGLNIGSHNNGISFNVSLSQEVGNWEASVGIGVTGYGTFANTGKGGLELRGSFQAGFNDGKTSLSLGTNVFKGVGGMSDFSQRTGILNVGIGDFKASYENDGYPFALGQKGLAAWAGDGDDKYRSAAVRLSYGKLSAGFNLFTGSRTNYKGDNDKIGSQKTGAFGEKMPNGYVIEDGPKYRMGVAYLGYGSTKLGIDSDRWIRHPIQDNLAHNMKIPDTRQPGFKSLSDNIAPFFQTSTFSNQSSPTFTLYGF